MTTRSRWRVKVQGLKRPVTVDADWYRIDRETGALYFRNRPAEPNSYPVPVLCVAPGQWITITKVER